MKALANRKKHHAPVSQKCDYDKRWVRTFVTEIAGRSSIGKANKRSFTLYKITSYVYPKDFPEAMTAVTVLKRFKELNQLQNVLSKIHDSNNLPGEVPRYPHCSYFKRFDVEVIEQRRKITQEMLEHVADHPVLFTSVQFVNFFESSQSFTSSEDMGNIENIRSSLLLPTEIIKPIEYQNPDRNGEIQMENGHLKQKFTNQEFNETKHKLSVSPKHESTILHYAPNSPMSSKYVPLDRLSVDALSDDLSKSCFSQLSDKSSSQCIDEVSSSPSRLDTVSIETTSELTSSLQNSYIFEAGYILHLGAQNEVEGNFQMAFDYYKAGIEKLLVGVQGETSELWRNIVKEKINKYLSYAENIYTNHLNSSDKPKSTKEDIFKKKYICESKNLSICHPYEYLSKYKFNALLSDQIMLVTHFDTKSLYAMKVIQKQCTCVINDNKNDLPILPYGVPYMVKLISYIETKNFLFLILQFVSNGNLFTHFEHEEETVFPKISLSDEVDSVVNKNSVNSPPKLTCESREIDDSVDDILKKTQILLSSINETLYAEKTHSNTEFDTTPQVPSNGNHFPIKTVQKWGAELLLTIDHLHQRGVICRHLNPNNLLIGEKGNLMLTYILGKTLEESLVSIYNNTTLDFMYVAPELLNSPLEIADERVCDFWSYGALMYKLITGKSLSAIHPTGFNSHTILTFPHSVSKDEESFLTKLLCYDPFERLGAGPGGIDEIKFHPFFSEIDWSIVETEYDLNLM